MKALEIRARRSANQRLDGPLFSTPLEVVRHFSAMQAQDYHGAKWAVAQRCGENDAGVEMLFQEGHILRTHLCRPTWHFVLPEDIRWLLALTKERVHQASAFMYRKLELDPRSLNRVMAIIARTLEGGKHLERDALVTALERARVDTSGFRSTYFMMYAELEGLVCSGPRVGKQFTYALLEERVPKANTLSREEALAELTRRYFNSRGPACLPDFALWSGLTVADARKGIAMVGNEFARVTINGRDNWHPAGAAPVKFPANTINLLPNYDEYGIGYKDRSAFYDPEIARLSGSRNNPVFRHLIVLNGRMVGTWDRVLSAKTVAVQTSLFAAMSAGVANALKKAAKKYAGFLGLAMKSA